MATDTTFTQDKEVIKVSIYGWASFLGEAPLDLIVYLRYTIFMAASKKTHFNAKEKELAALGKALSHPARVKILAALICSQYCNCCRLTENMPLAQSTVSQHLKVLKDLGFIQGSTEGLKTNYRLNPKAFDSAFRLLEELLTTIKKWKGEVA